jgi:hypothetical protein
VVKFLLSDEACYVSGAEFVVDGAMTSTGLLPTDTGSVLRAVPGCDKRHALAKPQRIDHARRVTIL